MRRHKAYFLALIVVLASACAVAVFQGLAISQADNSEVFVARVDGEIDGRIAEYVGRVVSEAEDAGARAVVVTLDTPGGRLDATQQMVEDMNAAKEVPVIAYVTPQGARAASAGTFIMMGSDVAAMAPQTRLGAATPVDAFGQDIPGDMGEKVTNDAAAFISGLAEAHGRNEAWAESAVRDAVALDASEALDRGVVEYVQPDLRSVLEAVDGASVEPKDLTLEMAGAAIVQKPLSFKERFGIPLYALVVPLVIVILLSAGAGFAILRSRRWQAMTGREGMIGEIGTVRVGVSGSSSGMVFVHGELWRALPEDPDAPPLEPGDDIEIVDFRRAYVIVRPAKA